MANIAFIFLIINIYCIQIIISSGVPLQFVTSSNSPTVSSVVTSEPHRQSGKRIPGPVTVTSRPYFNVKDGPIEAEEESAESKLGAWRRWFSSSKENLTKSINSNTNEKTFTQQQILDKLFSDYHKHLKEQLHGKNYSGETSRYHQGGSSYHKPTASSPWPIDIETADDRPIPDINHNSPPQRVPPHLANPPKDGWVSLEPIPWSSSKVSKWTPNRPSTPSTSQPPSWGQNGYPSSRPPFNNDQGNRPNFDHINRPNFEQGNRPTYGVDRPQALPWGDNKPQWNTEKPLFHGQKPVFDSSNTKPSWSEIPKPQWGDNNNNNNNNKPAYDGGIKPTWTDAPHKPSWSDSPGIKPSWSDVTQKPSWTDLTASSTLLGGVSNKPAVAATWTNVRPPSSSSGTHLNPLGIITDGKPPEWPSDPPVSNYKPAKPQFSAPNLPQSPSWQRPQGWGARPPLSSVVYKGEDGNDEKKASNSASETAAAEDPESGKWVLLSSTRGYTTAPLASSGRGTRAFRFTPNTVSMSTNRGIRLTVLPAINNTSTLSHGGLLEVDKTFESVDSAAIAANAAAEAAAIHAQLEAETNAIITSSVVPVKGNKNKINANKKPKPAKQQVNGTVTNGVRVFTAGQASPTEVQNRNKALIAAIGAGMLPATMAALVPMFLGRRRRRRAVEDVVESARNRLLLAWHGLPRSTFNVRRRRRAI